MSRKSTFWHLQTNIKFKLSDISNYNALEKELNNLPTLSNERPVLYVC